MNAYWFEGVWHLAHLARSRQTQRTAGVWQSVYSGEQRTIDSSQNKPVVLIIAGSNFVALIYIKKLNRKSFSGFEDERQGDQSSFLEPPVPGFE